MLLGARAATSGGRWLGLLALAGALQAVSGWPAGAYLSWLALGAFALFAGHGWRALVRLALAGVVAALLAAVLLVPAAEFVRETSYADTRPLDQVARDGYLTLLSWLRPAGGTGSLESSQLYLGIAPLLLAPAALLDWRRPAVRALALIAVLALVLSWGTHGPLFALLYRFLPGFRIIYLPARMGVVAAFALASLAAVGVAALADRRISRRRALLVAGTFAALAPLTLGQFWLSEGYDSFRRLLTNVGKLAGGPYLSLAQEAQYVASGVAALFRAAPALWLGLVVVDVLAAHQLARPPAFDPDRWYAPALQAASLRETLGTARVAGFQWHGEEHFLNRFPQSADPALLPPNLSLLAGVRDAQGYNPLLLRRAASYFAAVNARGGGSGTPDDHWLWLEQPLADPSPGLAVRHMGVDPAALWRARSVRLPLAAPLVVAGGGPAVSAALSFPVATTLASRLHVVTFLGQGTGIPQGAAVAQLRLLGSEGEWTVQLLAGEHTAEWAYERPDVKPLVRHGQAPIALRTQLVDAVGGRFSVFEYRASFDLPPLGVLQKVEVTPLIPAGPTTVHVAGLWREASVQEALTERGEPLGRISTSAGRIRVLRDEPERIEIGYLSGGGSTITITDSIYPGWVARTAGQVVPIRPTSPIQAPEDALFRAVDVPPGDDVLTLTYEPASLRIGLALTLLGTLLCGWLLVRPPRARLFSPSTAPPSTSPPPPPALL
jgi:hypothetical protein